MRISVDGSRIRNNKVAFLNLSGIVWTGPKCNKGRKCISRLLFLVATNVSDFSDFEKIANIKYLLKLAVFLAC